MKRIMLFMILMLICLTFTFGLEQTTILPDFSVVVNSDGGDPTPKPPPPPPPD